MSDIPCPVCGQPVVKKKNGPLGTYCSTPCRVKASNQRAVADGRAVVWADSSRRRRLAAKPVKPCRVCGEAIPAGQRALCGSAECERRNNVLKNTPFIQARRARIKGVESEHFASHDVFQRDGWVCGICREDVDQTLRFPDLRSASLDHIVPLSRGGGHTLDNVQCAHLGCNRKKGTLAVA